LPSLRAVRYSIVASCTLTISGTEDEVLEAVDGDLGREPAPPLHEARLDAEPVLDEGGDLRPAPQPVVGRFGLKRGEQLGLLFAAQFGIGSVVPARVAQGIGSVCVVALEDGVDDNRSGNR
jgi:hypothetical protein